LDNLQPVQETKQVAPTPAEVVTNPVATPVEKAVELTKETPKVSAPVAPVAPPAQTGPLTTASGFPAQEGTGPAKQRIPSEVKSMDQIPKGMAFVPNMDIGGTNTARNTLGQEGAIALAQQRGVPFGPYAETEQVLKDFNAQRVGPPITREMRKAINAPLPSNTPKLAGKVMKVGGVVGTLMAVSDLANAQSLAEAGLRGADIATDYIPGVATAKQALSPSTTNAGEQQQIDFLRRMQEAKVFGAGNRGKAFDPRIPYNSQLSNIGIPPPYGR
jgi:hypothetical protein